MKLTADVVVIGAGVIGTSITLELSRLGMSCLCLDRNSQPGHGSTAGSCAIIRMHYSTYDGTALAWEGYHYWSNWANYLEIPENETSAKFLQVGCLVMKTHANGFLNSHMSNSTAMGCPFEEWSDEKIMERLPIYDLSSYAPARLMDDPNFGISNGEKLTGGVYWPNSGYVTDPALAAQNLASAASTRGARFRMRATVDKILTDNQRVSGVRLTDGTEVHAPIVINVAGPASSNINKMAGVTDDMLISTRALKQEVAHVASPEGFNFETRGLIVSDSDTAVYCRPEMGNHILIGSEDPACDTHQWIDDDVSYNREFTDQWTTQVTRFAQRVPDLGIPQSASGVVELYDASTDWIPIYDKSSLPGFYMACGTSGNQFKNAPVVGKIMAELVQYCENGNDHDTQPLQFRLAHIQQNINVGFYSRKRPVNKESSFSVLG
ncbi:MAG: FAD-dependent oxidoreductase [Granulosicoccus sp.]